MCCTTTIIADGKLCIHKGRIKYRDENERETEQVMLKFGRLVSCMTILYIHMRGFTSFRACTLASFQVVNFYARVIVCLCVCVCISLDCVLSHNSVGRERTRPCSHRHKQQRVVEDNTHSSSLSLSLSTLIMLTL